jgi:hypothetical protein
MRQLALTVAASALLVCIQCAYAHETKRIDSVQTSPSDPQHTYALSVLPLRGDEAADPRNATRTYSTFPEWYIVYSAQEYASFVSSGRFPSQFPFWKATTQYWEASENSIDFAGGAEQVDSTTQTVLSTIGWSFAVENYLLGAYEKTIGRIFEWSNLRIKTTEDEFTQHVASEYGAFLLHTPWYDFPYFLKIGELWTTWGLSSITPRGIERRVIFTIGYAAKALYGGVIGYVSHSEFGAAGLTTTLTLHGVHDEALQRIAPSAHIVDAPEESHTVTTDRYRALTYFLKELSATDAVVTDVQRHTKIALSYIGSTTSTNCEIVPSPARVLYTLPLVTDTTRERVILETPANALLSTMRELARCAIDTEHVYDY